jgi:hypothetical protein
VLFAVYLVLAIFFRLPGQSLIILATIFQTSVTILSWIDLRFNWNLPFHFYRLAVPAIYLAGASFAVDLAALNLKRNIEWGIRILGSAFILILVFENDFWVPVWDAPGMQSVEMKSGVVPEDFHHWTDGR